MPEITLNTIKVILPNILLVLKFYKTAYSDTYTHQYPTSLKKVLKLQTSFIHKQPNINPP